MKEERERERERDLQRERGAKTQREKERERERENEKNPSTKWAIISLFYTPFVQLASEFMALGPWLRWTSP